jgi:hypothetical protein
VHAKRTVLLLAAVLWGNPFFPGSVRELLGQPSGRALLDYLWMVYGSALPDLPLRTWT